METVPRTQHVFGFGFLVEKFGLDAGVPAIELLFTAFSELRKLPTVPDFYVWTGMSGYYWWIAVPNSLPVGITTIIRDYLSGPISYDTMEAGEVSDMGLIPKWKYTSSKIYALAPASGGDDIDTWSYGSSLEVETASCFVTDEEK